MQGINVFRANRRRGEVEAMIDGERRILCLTLGALAELETAFSADNLAELASRFSGGRVRSADLIRILGAGLRGAGNRFSDEDVAGMSVDGGLEAAARAVRDLLEATFAPVQTPGEQRRPAGAPDESAAPRPETQGVQGTTRGGVGTEALVTSALRTPAPDDAGRSPPDP
jgi:hypothetical protein